MPGHSRVAVTDPDTCVVSAFFDGEFLLGCLCVVGNRFEDVLAFCHEGSLARWTISSVGR